MRLIKYFFSILIVFLLFNSSQAIAVPLSEQVKELLRDRLEAYGMPARLSVSTKKVYADQTLYNFYIQRIYHPVWIGDRGLKPIADDLINAISYSYHEGLNPEDYHLPVIESMVRSVHIQQIQNSPLNPGQLVDLELLLTDAFIILGTHYVEGKVDPEKFDARWHANFVQKDMKAVLNKAIETQKVRESLEGLLPPYSKYGYLRSALERYRDIKFRGGWPYVPSGPTLRKGDMDSRVLVLRERLIFAGDHDKIEDMHGELFDERIFEAVKRFQQRHGLDADGVVGPQTLSELNVPVEKRLEQVRLNMERWRWLPQDLGRRYIVVNIANFELDVIEDDATVLNMRAIVGRQYRTTPVFSSTMTYLVFSPFWHIPQGIASKDIIPEARKDIGYLQTKNIRILSGWGAEEIEIDPATIDWNHITARNFPYRLRQDPGVYNSLGRVKFMFPNKFNVYIHDTPDRELFGKPVRDFSSGCIRIDKPLELAMYLLGNHQEWTRDAIVASMNRKSERTLTLPRPIPVHILYWTAWATEYGTIHFRRDIYNRDTKVYEVLTSSIQ